MPAEHWSLVLDFAVKWQFHDIRELAVRKMKDLSTQSPTLALQVAASRKHNIAQWYLDAFVKLCERGRPITPEEGEVLGMLDVVRVSAIRTKLHSAGGGRGRVVSRSIYDSLPDIVVSEEQFNNITTALDLQSVRAPIPALSRSPSPRSYAQTRTPSPTIPSSIYS